MKRLLTIFTLLFVFFSVAHTSYAAQTYDMATTTNWNLSITGLAANDYLGIEINTANVVGDSKPDVIITAGRSDFNSRNASGSVYIIENSIITSITGTGQSLDLSNSANYTVRIDGAAAGDSLALGGLYTYDINGDGRIDLFLGASAAGNNSRGTSGSVYYISGTILSNLSGTGNLMDMATTTNWTIRYDGAAATENLGYNLISVADFNNNGQYDLVVGAKGADNNSRANSGSVYYIYDNLISAYSGTGNTVDLATTTNWNIRIDGSIAGKILGYNEENLQFADINGNGIVDSLLPQYNSGYYYVIYDSILSAYSGTGNTLDLNVSTNYNIRYLIGGGFATGFSIADINNNGTSDLVIADGWNGPSYVYLLFDSLIDDYSGTGNNVTVATSTNYSVRLQSAGANDFLGTDPGTKVVDYNNDSKIDIVIPAGYASPSGRDSAGSIYFISNDIVGSLSGTGNNLSLSDSAYYSLRYDGQTALTYLAYTGGLTISDINNDGMPDFMFGAAYFSSQRGKVWFTYNFPHTITESTTTYSDSRVTVTGTVTATSSITNISGVQFQIDNNNAASGWTSCTASDGSFNSTSEAFTCTTTSEPETAGTHTIYLRSYDANTSYTAQSRYASSTYTIAAASNITSSSSSGSNDTPQIVQSSDGSNATGGVMTPVRDSSTNGQNIFVIIEPNTINFSAFVSAQSTAISATNVAGLLPNPFTGVMPTAGKTKTNAVLAGGSMLGVKTGGSVSWQVGNVQQIWYKAYAPTGSDKSPAKIVPELQKKQSIVALSYTDANLVPPGRPKSKFNAKTLKLAHSIDGITWKILPTSVVDTKNKTVAALHKVGGYYMVVGR